MAENGDMKTLARFTPAIAAFVLLTGIAATADAALPRGTDLFSLGMTRVQVDSALTARSVEVVTDRVGLLACTSDQPGVRFERYEFFQNGAGAPNLLWRVTLLYDERVTRDVFEGAVQNLTRLLGTPAGSGVELDPERPDQNMRQLTWVDEAVTVQVGARFPEGPVTSADRMTQTWTDRRLRLFVAARLKQIRDNRSPHSGR
jgi:hypothetical protein